MADNTGNMFDDDAAPSSVASAPAAASTSGNMFDDDAPATNTTGSTYQNGAKVDPVSAAPKLVPIPTTPAGPLPGKATGQGAPQQPANPDPAQDQPSTIPFIPTPLGSKAPPKVTAPEMYKPEPMKQFEGMKPYGWDPTANAQRNIAQNLEAARVNYTEAFPKKLKDTMLTGAAVLGTLPYERLRETFLDGSRGFNPAGMADPLAIMPWSDRTLWGGRPFHMDQGDADLAKAMGKGVLDSYNEKYLQPMAGIENGKPYFRPEGAGQIANQMAMDAPFTALDIAPFVGPGGKVLKGAAGTAGKAFPNAAASAQMAQIMAQQAAKNVGTAIPPKLQGFVSNAAKLPQAQKAAQMAAQLGAALPKIAAQVAQTINHYLPYLPWSDGERLRRAIIKRIREGDFKASQTILDWSQRLSPLWHRIPDDVKPLVMQAAELRGSKAEVQAVLNHPQVAPFMAELKKMKTEQHAILTGEAGKTGRRPAKWAAQFDNAESRAATYGPKAQELASKALKREMTADELFPSGVPTALGERYLQKAERWAKSAGVEATHSPHVFSRHIEEIIQNMDAPLLGLSSRVQRMAQSIAKGENVKEMSARVAGAVQPGMETEHYLAAQLSKMVETMQLYALSDLIDYSRRASKAVSSPATGDMVEFPIKAYIQGMVEDTTPGGQSALQQHAGVPGVTPPSATVSPHVLSQAIASLPPTMSMPARAAATLQNFTGLMKQPGSSMMPSIMDTRPFKLWEAIKSDMVAWQLGLSPPWMMANAAQQLITNELAMWRGPKDILPSIMARFVVRAAKLNPAVDSALESFTYTYSGAVGAGVNGQATANANLPTAIARYLAFRDAVTKPVFEGAKIAENEARRTLGAYFILREIQKQPTAVANALGKAWSLNDAMLAIEHGARDPKLMQKALEGVVQWQGDYSKLKMAERRALRSCVPYALWYEQCARMAWAMRETPFKNAFMGHLAQIAPPLLQPPDMNQLYQTIGAIPRYHSDGTLDLDKDGNRKFTLRGDMLAYPQMIELVSQIAGWAAGTEAPMENATSFNSPIHAAFALLGRRNKNFRDFYEPDLVSSGGKQKKADAVYSDKKAPELNPAPMALDIIPWAQWPRIRQFAQDGYLFAKYLKPYKATELTGPIRENIARNRQNEPIEWTLGEYVGARLAGITFLQERFTGDDQEGFDARTKDKDRKSANRQAFNSDTGKRAEPPSGYTELGKALTQLFKESK